jgi:K+-sensing histidine kinase KdpD
VIAEVLALAQRELVEHGIGCGIAPADMPHRFEAFYTTKPHGMGMGLRIGASIVEAHGGRLWVTPNAGPGVTFSVRPADGRALSRTRDARLVLLKKD